MKRKRLLIGFSLLALTLGTGAMANEVYKWTDDDGNVHYEDRPSGSRTEELMALSYSRTDSSSVQRQVETQTASRTARRDARAKADEEKKAAAQEEAEAADKQKKCDSYRARLQTFIQSRRLYRQDENGERVYLDETQAQEARDRVEELISENCTS